MPENFRRSAHSKEDVTRISSVTAPTLDLTSLTDREEKIIQAVIQKDEIEKSILESKIGEVRREIQEIRKAGALTAGDDQNAICARCKYKFRPIIMPWGDHGQRCITCKFRVCSQCCALQSNGSWLCILCSKYRQEKFLTGEWMSKGKTPVLQGSDLLRASLRDRRKPQAGYEETDGVNYTQRPAKASRNSQSSTDEAEIWKESRRHQKASPLASQSSQKVRDPLSTHDNRPVGSVGECHRLENGKPETISVLNPASEMSPMHRVLGDKDSSSDATSPWSVDIGKNSLLCDAHGLVTNASGTGHHLAPTNTNSTDEPPHAAQSVHLHGPFFSSLKSSHPSLFSREESLKTSRIRNRNSYSEHLLYYDDVKLANRNLSQLSTPDSRSSSSLCSDYSLNPRYRSLRLATGSSQLELFRKQGEKYIMRRKKAELERANTDEIDSQSKTAENTNAVTSKVTRISVHTNNECIPHWHEILRRQSVVEGFTKQVRPEATSPSPPLNVTPSVQEELFSLVKPKLDRPAALKNPNYLSPDHSRDNSSSSLESISVYIEAARASMNFSEEPLSKAQNPPVEQTLSSQGTNALSTSVASTPKPDISQKEVSEVKQCLSDMQKQDIPKMTVKLPQTDTAVEGKATSLVQPFVGKTAIASNLIRDKSRSVPHQKLQRSGFGSSLPSNWGPFKDWKGKRKLPTIGKLPESKEEKEMGSGDKRKLAPTQRRGSYSQALENQKITVILSKGNANNSRVGSWDYGVSHPAHANTAIEPLDLGKERNSDSSSVASLSSQTASCGTNNDCGISEDTKSTSGLNVQSNLTPHSSKTSETRSTHSALPSKFRYRRSPQSQDAQTDSSDSTLRDNDGHNATTVKGTSKNTKYSPSNESSTPAQKTFPAKDTVAQRSMTRSDSFEEVYNANVNRLVEMMTGSQVSAVMEGNRSNSAKPKRELPAAPKIGKGKDLLLQRSLSLSEEMAQNAKYQSFDEGGEGGVRGGGGSGESVKESGEEDKDVKVVEEKLLLPSDIKKKQSLFPATSNATTGQSSSAPKTGSLCLNSCNFNKSVTLGNGSCPSVAQIRQRKENEFGKGEPDSSVKANFPSRSVLPHPKVEPPVKHHVRISMMPVESKPSAPPRYTDGTSQQRVHFLKPILKKSHPSEMKEQVGSNGLDRKCETLKMNLCRSESNVSDSLSVLTETSEPCVVESLPYDSDAGSDSTLHDRDFEESFSDYEESLGSFSGSLIHCLENLRDFGGDDREVHESDSDLTILTECDATVESNESNSKNFTNHLKLVNAYKEDSNPEGYSIEMELTVSSQMSDWDSECRGSEEYSTASRESTESRQHLKLEERDKNGKFVMSENARNVNNGAEIHEDENSLASENCVKDEIDTLMLECQHDETPIPSAVGPAGQEKADGKVTLLSLAQKHRLINSCHSHVPEAKSDLDHREHESTVGSRRSGSGSMGGAYYHEDNESASDSGVNSSQTSRTVTPDQRAQSKIPQSGTTTPDQRTQNLTAAADHQARQPVRPQSAERLAVPGIAVNTQGDERDKEEEDDFDELFNNHRPHLLGSRNSLADSRESIYSVYSDAGEVNYGRIPVSGEIFFNLTYNAKSSVLEVHIKQCKELAPVDTKHNRSDPYVKTYLLPDKTRGSKRKTKIKKHTLNPTFDEILKYHISKAELESRSLWVTVCHNDHFGRNDFLGEVTIPLDYYRFDDNMPRWYPLQERVVTQDTLMCYKGDLFISIKYVPADMVEAPVPKKKSSSFRRKNKEKEKQVGLGELHVLVREAQNLTAMRASAGSNPFCKGYLLPDVSHASKQKTPVIKKTTNPQWQHILVFEGMEQSLVYQHGLELTVWDHEKLSSNDFLGGVRLNLGQGNYQGKPVDWMDARGEEIDAWQSMMSHPNEWIDAQLPLRASMGKQNVKK